MTFEEHLAAAKDAYESENYGTKVLIAYVCISKQLLSDPSSEEFVTKLVSEDVARMAAEAVREAYE